MRVTSIVFATAIALVGATPVIAQQDLLGLPGPINFQDRAFELAWSSQPSETYVKHEYVPAGQSVETFEDMFLVEAVAGPLTPIEAARSQVQSLEARRGTDPVLNYELLENEGTGEVMLDFLTSDLSAEPIVEWNAYRYVPLDDGGVGLFAISRRGYGEEGAKAFLQGLGTTRSESIAALAAYAVPPITLAK
jgi:hypothetical protein